MLGGAGWRPPDVFDEYQILRLLGRGGMGEVYLAHDTMLDRAVAVKFISALQPDAFARAQFLVEARAAARLQHPNVLTIHRVGLLDDRPYIVSELLRGQSLDVVPKPMPWSRVLDLGLALARGLAAAHRRGVLHRDIKPANAIVTHDGEVKLLDFGLAKLVGASPLQEDLGCFAPGDPDSPTEDPRPPNEPRAGLPPAEEAESERASSGTLLSVESPLSERGKPAAAPLELPFMVSTVRGTPLYMAPELWQGEPATRRSDVYSLGALLYELCSGQAPNAGAALHEVPLRVTKIDAPSLAGAVPAVDPDFAALVDRCLRRNPAERFASGDELRDALEQLTIAGHRISIPDGNPYRGLLPFEAEHRALFFGREAEIGTLIERLRSESLLLVAGDSGVGKSSLCHAGVLPLVVVGHALRDGRSWEAADLVPGRSPLAALALALAGLLETSEEDLAARLRADEAALGRDLARHLGDARGVLLFIDQLEELVTISDPAEAELVGRALTYLAAGVPGVRLLMTVRSDFLARVASVPGLGDELGRALYLLRPLSPEKIRAAIVGPARVKGVAFESEGLVETLVESTARAEGSLPLLQFALAELWDARASAGAAITAAALEAIGGVAGALARHADQVLLSLPASRRSAARRILIALVTLEGTRARRTEAELVAGDPAARAALEALVRGRLLLARDADQGTAYEVAHEALLRGWHRLRRWLDEQTDSRIEKSRLELAAAEWERLGRTREALWSARQLAEAAILVPEEIAPRETAFLAASRRALRNRRRAGTALVAAVPIALGLLYGMIELRAHRDLQDRVALHAGEARLALAGADAQDAELATLRLRAFALFDAQQRDEGERLWARSLALSAEVDRAYGRASQAFETALTIDAERQDVRDMLGDVLRKRAVVAERDRRPAQRDDLLQRLALYDVEGEHRRRFGAPAHLAIETAPAGARVTLEQLAEDEGGRARLAGTRDLGPSPIAETEVARGSYVLVLAYPGHATVRYPVLLGRDERFRAAVDLPLAAEIPEGLVYVPPGRFIFGSSIDENQRRAFLATVPAHEVRTGPYLIARHETTYADWLEYLRALPPEESARRAPKVGEAGLTGALDLSELPGGTWQLTLRPTTQTHTVRIGEPLAYGARTQRAVQQWARLPVSAISNDDASAYVAWLAGTGRVRGARLCTEQEWERAARGADEREFPNGNHLDSDDANIDETYGKDPSSWGPDEVGSHPASRSPFRIDDMAGNVFEWVTSSVDPGEHVIRGGAYFYDQMTARSTNRSVVFEAKLRDPRLGLRICASFPRP
jgi:serine/threonine protein kinase/formylglycine-generating enzyme required for sulfatase activity